jgi:potassium channel LctB
MLQRRMGGTIIKAVTIGVLLFLGSMWLHIWMIKGAKRIWAGSGSDAVRHNAAYLTILASHLAVAALFAVGFAMAMEMGLGGFKKSVGVDAMDLFYFSLINITTVGLSDIYPTGHLRVITGIESLTGFLLISCTAQFVYQTMRETEN